MENQKFIDDALEDIKKALQDGKIHEAISLLQMLEPVDQADTLSELEPKDQSQIFAGLDSETSADILEELNNEEAAELAASLPSNKLAEVLDEASPDVAADILNSLPIEQATNTLRQMEEADDVRPLLQYSPDTAGGLMTTVDFVLKAHRTADEVIESIRQVAYDANAPYYLFVTNDPGELVGVVGLRSLIASPPASFIEDIMVKEVRSVLVTQDQEEVAQIMKRYRLSLLPVVDELRRLVGVIYADDIAFILEEEATEDMYALANVSGGDVQVWSPFHVAVKRRLPWLILNLFTAFLAAGVVSFFEATITKAAVLASFLGVVAGQGGNAATQTLAIVVRGIALNEVEFSDVYHVLLREVGIGVLNGITIGALVGAGAYYWHGSAALGLVVSFAMLSNMIAASCAGTIVPLGLRACKLDPALASSVLVTTVTDCVGFGLTLYFASVAINSFGIGF